MMIYHLLSILFFIATLTSCQEATVLPGNIEVKIYDSKPSITKVKVENDQLIVSGKNLSEINLAKLEGSSQHTFQIESKSANQLILNARSALNILVGESLNLIVSNASASATFPISFELKNGQVQSVHLGDMGASTGQVLRFNGTNWAPSSLSASQIYAGTYDASTNTPDIASGSEPAGTYFVVTTAGTYNFGQGPISFNVGDWVIFNGTIWEKLTNTNGVVSFKGRTGVVVPANDDYGWSMLQKTSGKLTGSRISEIADVDAVGIQDGDILIWNNSTTKWEVGTVPAATLNSGSVTNTTIASGAIDSSKISDGSITNVDIAAGAAIDQSKIAGLTAALAGKEASLPTGGTTAQYFRGDKTLSNFSTSVLGTQLAGYSVGTAIPLVAADTIPQAMGKLEAYIASLNASQSNYVLRNGTSAMTGDLQMGNNQITGLGAPGADADAATKKYVDDAIAGVGGGPSQWTTSGSNISNANAGNVGIGTSTPSASLEVAGQVKITGGSPGVGKVLTSDATGLATWATPSGGLPAGSASLYSARVATTDNIALSGVQTVDGISLVAGDRVLVKNQTTISQNGVYEVAAGAWSRVADLDTWSDLNGYEIVILEGNSFSGFRYSSASNASGTIGTSAIRFSSQGAGRHDENIGIGIMALNQIANSDNVAIGAWSMTQATSAWSNVAVGNYALQDLTSGNRNSAFGVDAALNTQDGYYNTAIGNEALENNISGFSNTAVGKSALNATTGSNNTALGYLSGSAITSGTNNVVIGSNDGASIAASSNNILISDGAGNLRMQVDGSGNVGFGAAASGGAKVQVEGQIKITGGSPGAGKVLTSDAAGLATWTTIAAGGVTSVSGTAPISVSGTTTPVVSISQATTSANGYLSSTDWNIFNDKQAPLSSGVTINGVTYPANGTLPMQVTVAPVNATDVVNKQYVDGYGLWGKTGSDVYRSVGRVGIGTSTPGDTFHVVAPTGGGISIENPGEAKMVLRSTASSGKDYEVVSGENGEFMVVDPDSEGIRMYITSGGYMGIGTTDPNSKLHVNGETTIEGTLTTAYATSTSLSVDFFNANVISTTAAAGTLVLNSMKSGTSYTLIVQNTGNYTLSGSGISTWRCAPACPGGVISNSTGHLLITILKAGSSGYVSYITDMQ